MRCPACRSQKFLSYGTIHECVSCGYKGIELEGWARLHALPFKV